MTSTTQTLALNSVINQLERKWIPDDFEFDGGSIWNPPISLPLNRFLEAEEAARWELGAGKRFVDIGCGIGTKLLLMQALSWESHGIERHGGVFDIAFNLVHSFPESNIRLYPVNANNIDATWWNEFDFLYSYRPYQDDAKLRELHGKIAEGVKHEAVLYTPDGPKLPYHEFEDDLYILNES